MRTQIPINKKTTVRKIAFYPLMLITVLLSVDAFSNEPGTKEANLTLPKFSSCSSSQKPVLPAKWESGALLQHFSDPELVAANLVYDESAAAMRFTLAGMTGGSGDFLLTDNGHLYGLSGGYPSPTQCRFIGRSDLKVPTRQWLKDDSLCAGEAKVTGKDLVWWKYKVAPVTEAVGRSTFSHSAPRISRKKADSYASSPQPAGADWIWYHKNNQQPYRTMFSVANNDYGILGRFTFNYLPTFRLVKNTNLQALKDLCGLQTKAENPDFNVDDVASLLAENSLSEEQKTTLPGQWVPGLQPTSHALPPSWPSTAGITTFFTSVNYCYAPFPSRVYYDWKAQSQLTSMYWNKDGAVPTKTCATKPEFVVQDALLRGRAGSSLNHTGFIFNRDSSGKPSQCAQVLPGIQVPNWKDVDNCVAKAQLAPQSILNPGNEIVKILRCPITEDPVPQVFWTWYSVTGTPMVFMQSNANTDGTGLNLADYHDWEPGRSAPEGSFDLPEICEDTQNRPVPDACHSCHLPLKKST